MKKRVLILILILAIVVAGALLLVKKKQREIASLEKPPASRPAIQAVAIGRGNLEVTAHYLGVIEPHSRSDLSSRISGSILSVNKREGDPVRQGEIVATIDDRELTDRASAVHAESLAARQRVAGAKSALELQKAINDRDLMLFREGAISREALERSTAAYEGAQAAHSAADETLQGLGKNAAAARTQAEYAKIAAPFTGIVVKRWNEPGDLAVPGKPILTIETTSPCRVVFQVPQEALPRIGKGAKVYLRNGSQRLTATVSRIYPALGKNLLASVEISLPLAPFMLPSGSSLGVDLVTQRVAGLLVPENALVKTDRGIFVYLVDKDVVRIRQVELLGTGTGQAAVSGPIQDGNIVAVGQENKLLTLAEGTVVHPVVAKP
jgi:RND family efflux transporter MFP subunit